MKELLKALEADVFYGEPQHVRGLKKMLRKLNIKSAKNSGSLAGGAPLMVESLDSVLNQVTFNMDELTPWNTPRIIKP